MLWAADCGKSKSSLSRRNNVAGTYRCINPATGAVMVTTSSFAPAGVRELVLVLADAFCQRPSMVCFTRELSLPTTTTHTSACGGAMTGVSPTPYDRNSAGRVDHPRSADDGSGTELGYL